MPKLGCPGADGVYDIDVEAYLAFVEGDLGVSTEIYDDVDLDYLLKEAEFDSIEQANEAIVDAVVEATVEEDDGTDGSQDGAAGEEGSGPP